MNLLLKQIIEKQVNKAGFINLFLKFDGLSSKGMAAISKLNLEKQLMIESVVEIQLR